MRRKEASFQSPLRLLDRAIGGGLGKGNLGVILGAPGVGKSACLVQLGLDALLRDRPVLHVSIAQSVEDVSAWYDALFDELAGRVDLADRAGVRDAISRGRLIWSVADGLFGPHALEEAIDAFERHLALEPAVILVDGFEWEDPGYGRSVAAIKATAAGAGAELWLTVRDDGGRGAAWPGPLARLADGPGCLADVAVALEPRDRHVRITLVKDLDRYPGTPLPLVLEGSALHVLQDRDGSAPPELAPEACTLLATGSAGAEEEFGACAERWGVHEVNFTFGGRREIARARGVIELSDDELRMGEVSAVYVQAHLHRTLPRSPEVARVLQAIWHQVSTAGEVFAVGTVTEDKTAHGGTGWAVELARRWGKPVHLFDQERVRWLRWDGHDWVGAPSPAITRPRFAGAGTRSLSEDGRVAIRDLFARSFGPPPA